jgi:16S rRNA (uracil1498-N3)-methyltransferase
MSHAETIAKVETFVRRVEDSLRLIAAIGPGSRSLKTLLAERIHAGEPHPTAATVMIGPEGDFTPAEISTALSHGFLPLSLGPIILRSETAAIYALSITGHELM